MLGEFTQRIGCLKCEIGVYSNDAFGCVEEKKKEEKGKTKASPEHQWRNPNLKLTPL